MNILGNKCHIVPVKYYHEILKGGVIESKQEGKYIVHSALSRVVAYERDGKFYQPGE